jgi:membrane dipeptidase
MESAMPRLPIFDGHNDVLLHLSNLPDRQAAVRGFLEGGLNIQIDLPRARQGGLVGGLFALYSPRSFKSGTSNETDPEIARADMFAEIAVLKGIERQSQGAVRVCRDTIEIREAVAADAMAVVMHIEGAEAIDANLDALETFYAAGVRSIGPVWSRPNVFGHGVPMLPDTAPDTGPGLTETGMSLVRACNEMRILIDLSHINEQGFWDVARLSRAPLVATHSNAFAVANHSRNLTDRQLDAIRDSDGLVGVNYGTGMLRPDGIRTADTPLDIIVTHVDHLIERLGPSRVALGSDMDGTLVPAEIRDVSDLPRLVDAFRRRGYDDDTLRRICFDNWLDVLARTWA